MTAVGICFLAAASYLAAVFLIYEAVDWAQEKMRLHYAKKWLALHQKEYGAFTPEEREKAEAEWGKE